MKIVAINELDSAQQATALALLGVPVTDVQRENCLLVARQAEELLGVVWGQPQEGGLASLLLPRLAKGVEASVAERLLAELHAQLRREGVGLAQVLMASNMSEDTGLLERCNYRPVGELLYLACDVSASSASCDLSGLRFERYDEEQAGRMADIVERTYVGSLDCPAIEGWRKLEEVLDGYRDTGTCGSREWWLVVAEGGEGMTHDIGCLLLAEHLPGPFWELMYLGVAAEERGHGHGRAIVWFALGEAEKRGISRIVLAVDRANQPAVAMYGATGFYEWDRRSVWLADLRTENPE